MKKLAEAVAAIKESEYLMSSPVAYMVDFLDMYVQDKLSPREMARDFKDGTLNAQFFFFHMPQEEIQHNQRIFTNEFAFADALYKITQKGRQAEKAEFTLQLLECVADYADNYTVRKPPAV